MFFSVGTDRGTGPDAFLKWVPDVCKALYQAFMAFTRACIGKNCMRLLFTRANQLPIRS
jgi:hypothetical protein